MCGRFTLANPGQIALRFDVPVQEGASAPRYNIAPSQLVLAVHEEDAGRMLAEMRWGFRPSWAADSGRPAPINARAETLADRPLFRSSLAHGRCLIVADGFYEWQTVPGMKTKQPMYMRRRDGALFGFAGLSAPPARGQTAEPATCAIITCAPNELMAPIHNRMPVLLAPEEEVLWLDSTVTDPELVLPLLRPFPSELLTAYPVSRAVNDVGHDGPALIAPQPAAVSLMPR